MSGAFAEVGNIDAFAEDDEDVGADLFVIAIQESRTVAAHIGYCARCWHGTVDGIDLKITEFGILSEIGAVKGHAVPCHHRIARITQPVPFRFFP